MFIDVYKEPEQKVYKKIISLVPSQTELLHDLGLEEQVIGITKFCVHPATWSKEKLKVGGTKKINIPLIKTLGADLVIANKEENVKEEVEALAMDLDVYVSDIKNLTDAIDMIKHTGKLTGTEKKATELAENITSKFDDLSNHIFIKRKIKTAYIVWKDPYMVAGGDTFINDMMSRCGLENFYKNQNRYPEIQLNNLTIKDGAELVLLSSEPYPFKEKHIQEMQSCIPSSTIMLADGEMFSWYGSRVLKAADYFKTLRNDIDNLMK